MKKKSYLGLFVWLILSIVLFCLLPLAGLTYKYYKSIYVLKIKFIIIYYIYFIIVGIFAGRYLKKMWSLPIISYIFFVYSTYMSINSNVVFMLMYQHKIDLFTIATDRFYLTFLAITILVTALIKWETSLNPKEEAPSIDVK